MNAMKQFSDAQRTGIRSEINQLLGTGRLPLKIENEIASVLGTEGPGFSAKAIARSKDDRVLLRIQKIIGPRRGNGAVADGKWTLIDGSWIEDCSRRA